MLGLFHPQYHLVTIISECKTLKYILGGGGGEEMKISLYLRRSFEYI